MEPLQTTPIASAAEFEAWLIEHGTAASEIWVEIFKKSSKQQTVTFDELLDLAICHGWIDVKTKGIDERRYAIRFVPRKPGSNWSAINRERVRYLLAEGRMTDAGIALLPDELKPA
ncbi:MAG: hypothetical protein KF883_07035 [Thermomicrobiales bacterium]|nr:hypothetical protein [Thermomicrobiales bacterium]